MQLRVKRLRLLKELAGAALLLLPMGASQGAELGVSNEAALARATFLPALGETQVAAESVQWRLSVEFSNEYVEKSGSNEQLILDGETQSYTLSLSRGLSRRWTAHFLLPLLHTGGGFLDSHIDGWHEMFGLPEGGRDEVPHDSFRYTYTRNGQTLFDLREGGTGFGDLQVGLGHALWQGALLRASVDLPTGNENRLTGGSWGAAMWLDQGFGLESGSKWAAYLSAGASLNQKVGPLEDLQKALVPIAGAGLSIRAWSRLELLANVYLHGRLYDGSKLAPLDRPGMPLAAAARWCLAPKSCLELGFQEDLSVSASPDFTLRLAFRQH